MFGFLMCDLENKKSLSFISFDVCDFYPSITEKLLNKALDFANKYRQISKQERDIILHAKQSLLFWDNTPWEKKDSNNNFDVTMGSYDGAIGVRGGGAGGLQPPNFETNYHFRAIPIEIFGQFVGLSINFRSSK